MSISTHFAFFTILLLIAPLNSVNAHGGRTNSKGCHNDKARGDYHCHNRGYRKTTKLKPKAKSKPKTAPSKYSIKLVKETQQLLKKLGYSVGRPDGMMGNKTSVAIRSFQRKKRLDVTGIPSKSLIRALKKAIKAKRTSSTSNPTKSTLPLITHLPTQRVKTAEQEPVFGVIQSEESELSYANNSENGAGISSLSLLLSSTNQESSIAFENYNTKQIQRTSVFVKSPLTANTGKNVDAIWQGFSISALMSDKGFNKNIGAGDQLDVALKVTLKQDSYTGIFINSDFEITSVIEHFPQNNKFYGIEH